MNHPAEFIHKKLTCLEKVRLFLLPDVVQPKDKLYIFLTQTLRNRFPLICLPSSCNIPEYLTPDTLRISLILLEITPQYSADPLINLTFLMTYPLHMHPSVISGF